MLNVVKWSQFGLGTSIISLYIGFKVSMLCDRLMEAMYMVKLLFFCGTLLGDSHVADKTLNPYAQ